jgi:hypothetical protein
MRSKQEEALLRRARKLVDLGDQLKSIREEVEQTQDLACLLVDAQQPRSAVEADRLQVPQDHLDIVRALAQWPADRPAHAHNARGLSPALEQPLWQIVHKPGPPSRISLG